MSILATCLGFPRIGPNRELKRGLDHYWENKISDESLTAIGKFIRQGNWERMRREGISPLPCNDFSLYDHVLDMAVCVGAIPSRFRGIEAPLTRYFAMARGLPNSSTRVEVAPLEMTKWFDTNYHYLVPEIETHQTFSLDATKILDEIDEVRALGVEARPVILGPVTFLSLSKPVSIGHNPADPMETLDSLLDVYVELFHILSSNHVPWIQLDEPGLATDIDESTRRAYRLAFKRLSAVSQRPKIMLTTYFAGIESALDLVAASLFEGLHVDLVRAPAQLDAVIRATDASMLLSLGIVDGRNVWRTDLNAAHTLVRRAVKTRGEEGVLVAPSCSLLHVPIDLDGERNFDDRLRSRLAFAAEKLGELQVLADAAAVDVPRDPAFEADRASRCEQRASTHGNNPEVRARMREVDDSYLHRASNYEHRVPKQRERLGLPGLPTTTIGSFPQTREVQRARADHRAGRLSDDEYQAFLEGEIRRCIETQESIGLDVLVHGEFERSDMVAFFGEQLLGFAFSENGWVQSYGSRCVKPPVIEGDVSRQKAMTVEWSRFAQSLTLRPVKGMLTGPVTMLQWSFVRDDQPRSETCRQIALALRDEVMDLEAAGIRVIQVDEPAIREALPLHRSEWADYLRWAVDAFRLTTSGVADETQIHTHMCYAEFSDILDAVAEMDADVLSIEMSRSGPALLADFARFHYPNDIGPGVFDIHSSRIPTVQEMSDLLICAAEVVQRDRLWCNPDCGLKTRSWSETETALRNMVKAARSARRRIGY